MTKQAKILSSTFKTEWNNPKGGLIYYHDVVLEGEGDKAWNIGSQTKNPDFLAVGQTLNFEVKDQAKRSIKRVMVEAPQQSGGGGYSQVGVTVGAALNQAVQLVSNGKVEMKDLKSTAHRLVEIAFELKEEFKDRG